MAIRTEKTVSMIKPVEKTAKIEEVKKRLDQLAPGHKHPPEVSEQVKEIAQKRSEEMRRLASATVDRRFKSKDKTRVTLWLDDDLLATLRARPGWQTRVNDILREALK